MAEIAAAQTTGDVLYFDADNETASNIPYGRKIACIKAVGLTASKLYTLKVVSTSGDIIWQHKTGAGAVDLSPPGDPIQMRFYGGTIWCDSDDAGTDWKIFVYFGD